MAGGRRCSGSASVARGQYEFSHVVVIESFAKALSSSKAAAAQAAAFEEANASKRPHCYDRSNDKMKLFSNRSRRLVAHL